MATGNNPVGRGDGKGGPSYTPWLLVRDQVGDTGSRPLAPGTVFWESPDVWTEGSLGINQPVVGEPTQVYAQVSNLGMEDAVGAVIKYWWANPSMAITEATANLIGTATVTIPSLDMLPFASPTPWVPVVQNGGHECLIVEAYLPVFDPLTDPMQPVYDRHVGQKNEQLITLQQGQKLQFHIDAFNFTRSRQEVAVEVTKGVLPANLQNRFGQLRTAQKFVAAAAEFQPRVNVAEKARRSVEHESKAANRLLSHAVKPVQLGPPIASVTKTFAPGEIRPVEVTGALPPHARPGEIYPLRIFERIGDAVVGGYTLYIRMEP